MNARRPAEQIVGRQCHSPFDGQLPGGNCGVIRSQPFVVLSPPALIERPVYADIAGTAEKPSETTIRYPSRVAWRRPKEGLQWDGHIYVDEGGGFADDFNIPETETLKAEIPTSLGWLRNLDRKRWSLTIPYERKPGEYRPVFPDFLFFRQEGDRVVIDILDPHGAHLDDAVMKARGLAVYAEDHGHRFGRIELLDKIEGRLLRLDLKNKKVRDQVKAIANNDGLVALYKAVGQ